MNILYSIVLHLFTTITVSTRFPFKRDDTNIKANEKHFPNGTVIGTYMYKDENDNPVHVRYYADDSSYGIELKSGKIIEEDSEQINKQQKLSKIDNIVTSSDISVPEDSMSETKSLMSEDLYKNISYNPYEVLNSYSNKTNRGHHKSADEYDIFLENVLKPSDKYNKESVRVYVDKNRRKARKLRNTYKISKYFNRFKS